MSYKDIQCNHNGIYQLVSIGSRSAFNTKEDKQLFEGLFFTANRITYYTDGIVAAHVIKFIADPRYHVDEICSERLCMFDIKIKKMRL